MLFMHALIQYRVNPDYRECRVSLEGHQLNMKQLLLVLAIALTTLPLRATLVENRPDVLFIAVDDMNDWISLLDPKSPIKTPNRDNGPAKTRSGLDNQSLELAKRDVQAPHDQHPTLVPPATARIR